MKLKPPRSRSCSRWRAWPLAAALLLPAGATRAQLAPDSARLAVKVAVLRLLALTYEAEVEYRCARHLSLTLLPRVVAGPVPAFISVQANAAGDRVQGLGVGLSPRLYIARAGTEGAQLAGLYCSVKGEYQHLRLALEREAWGEELAPNGLTYYVMRPRTFSETIRRYGGAATLGHQSQVLHPRVLLDFSVSLNALTSRSSAGEATYYRTSSVDYGYSGFFWSLGLSAAFVVK